MSPADLIFAIILVLAMLRGYSKGLLGTAASYVAPVLGFMIAQDWSDPVRDWLAVRIPAADLFVDLLAPLVVFVIVVVIIRLIAAILARLLGIGLSMPSRVLAGIATVAVGAVVLGAFVMLVHEIRPREKPKVANEGDAIASPIENALYNLDQELSRSLLAPHLEAAASVVVREAMSRAQVAPLDRPDIRHEIEKAAQKASEAAVDTITQPRPSLHPVEKPEAAAKPEAAKPEATKPEAAKAEVHGKPGPRAAEKPVPADRSAR